jgi:hypothetical protein
MNEDVVANRRFLSEEQSQADLATDAFGLTARGVSFDANNSHWNSETHAAVPETLRDRHHGH